MRNKHPSMRLSAAAPFIFWLGYRLHPKMRDRFHRLDSDEISSDDNERGPVLLLHEFLPSSRPSLENTLLHPWYLLSSCEARKSLWPRLDRKIAPHRTKRACLWDLLACSLHHLPSPPLRILFLGRDANRCCRISVIAAR